nr:MurR/RpiR family transcriptional regulator [uncultured Clostridium sp.]
MTIIEKMLNGDDFTSTEQNIVQFILNNRYQLEGLTIQEVTKNTYSSNATVIRVCHKLGFTGFRDFYHALLKEMESNKYIVNSIDYNMPFQIKDSTDDVVNSIYSLYAESIVLVQSCLNAHALDQIVTCMINAKRIFFIGMGDVKLTIKSAMNKLYKINCFPILLSENNEEQHLYPYITSNDCAFFITYRGTNNSYEEGMKILKKNHVNTIVLTANENSLLVKNSNFHICIPNQEKEKKIGTFYSQLAFQYVLNIIFALIYKRKQSIY